MLTVDEIQESALAKHIKNTIWTDLQNRYTDLDVAEVLNIASFLDPRFKDRHLHDKEQKSMECITTVLTSDSAGQTAISPDERDPVPATKHNERFSSSHTTCH